MTGKRYWYHFTFMSHVGGVTSYNSRSFGFDSNKVTCPRIAWAKENCGAHESSVMVNCSYLGRMTAEEFQG